MAIPKIHSARIDEHPAVFDGLDLPPPWIVENALSVLLVGRRADDDDVGIPGGDLFHRDRPAQSHDVGGIDSARDGDPVVDGAFAALHGEDSGGGRGQYLWAFQ